MGNPSSTRRAFSMVEIVLGLVILSLLTGMVLVTYQGQAREAAVTICRERLQSIRERIDRWQVEHSRPWFLPAPPQGSPEDPWGGPFHVDPLAGRIWAEPPEGVAADLELAYTAFPTRPRGGPVLAPIQQTAFAKLRLRWSWRGHEGTPIGYRIRRSVNLAQGFQVIAAVPPTPPLEFVDEGVAPGKVYYYRVEAILGPGDASYAAPLSPPVSRGVSVDTGAPELRLSSNQGDLEVGETILVRVEGMGRGSPLETLEFHGERRAVGPGDFRLDLPVRFTASGTQTIRASLWDHGGRRRDASLRLQVR